MPGQTIRYSSAFKLKVVTEIESGKFTIGEARRIYDIGGPNTIPSWIKKYGKHHLLNKMVRIQMKDEKDKVKELQNQIKALQRALSQSQVDNICWRSLIEVIDEKYSIDSKKNFGSKLPVELQEVLKKLT
ncbi:transposase [bacterium]